MGLNSDGHGFQTTKGGGNTHRLEVEFPIIGKLLCPITYEEIPAGHYSARGFRMLGRNLIDLVLPLHGKKRRITANDLIYYLGRERLALTGKVIDQTLLKSASF